MRRVLFRITISVVALLSLLFGVSAIAIYATVGWGNSVSTQGIATDPGDLSGCANLVIDIGRISLNDGSSFLPASSFSEHLRLTTESDTEISGALTSTLELDSALLGKSACVLLLGSDQEVTRVSSGDAPLRLEYLDQLTYVQSGTSIQFPIPIPDQSSVVTEALFTDDSVLVIDGVINYPQAQNALIACIIAALALLVIEIVLIVIGLKRRARHASTPTPGVSS